MKFENTTPFAATLYRGEPQPQIMLVTLLIKVAYAVADDGSLTVLPADQAVIRDEAQEAPLGLLPGDQVPYRPGVDVFVHANAYAPRSVPTKAMMVTLELGAWRHSLLVIGDRRWTKDGTILGPLPFERMPVTYAHAYGGVAAAGGGMIAFPDNPQGRGFVSEPAHLDGVLLPNIEHPDRRIVHWTDQPLPMAWAPFPPQTGVHLRRAVEVIDIQTLRYRLTPQTFSCAHPDLVLTELSADTIGRLTGVSPAGDFVFRVPRLPVRADVELSPRQFQLTPTLDTFGIFVEDRRIEASFRCSFRYHRTPGQSRVTRLLAVPSLPPLGRRYDRFQSP